MENFNFRNHVFQYGAAGGLVAFVISVVVAFGGAKFVVANGWVTYLVMMGLIGVCIYSGILMKKINGGYLTFKRAFLSIFFPVLIGAVVLGLLNYIYEVFIDPDYGTAINEIILDRSYEEMVANGETEENIEIGMHYFEKYLMGIKFLAGILEYLFYGVLIALIASSILKTEERVLE